MAHVAVRLLGPPSLRIDGADAPSPKGAKSWAVLAYLAATGRPCPRTELAELLFGRAADPLGALRWNLAALRRSLERPEALRGDPVALDASDLDVDLVQLASEGAGPDGIAGGAELLAGLSFPDSPLFELWLADERRRLRQLVLSRLREDSISASAAGDHEVAIRAARDLVLVEPFDEGHHALLIRTLALSGDGGAAEGHYDRCVELFTMELQTHPGPAVLAAVEVARRSTAVAVPEYDEVCARLNVGWQSFLAGAVDHGLDVGRGAVEMAEAHGDVVLRVAARLFLAGMLSMSVRGWDEVGTVTSEAARLARDAGLAMHEASARGIRAGSELMRGDYVAARRHATIGASLADDPEARALNLALLAGAEADVGRLDDAHTHAAMAVECAPDCRDPVKVVYAHAYAAHVHLLAGEPDAARPALEQAIEAAAPVLVMKPWPMAMLAEVDVRAGRLEEGTRLAMLAEGLAAATGVAYQRALALRVLALAAEARGEHEAAVDHLLVALAHARRTTAEGYAFHWPVAWVLETLAVASARVDDREARRWVGALRAHAAEAGMTTFVGRADGLSASMA